MDAARLETIPYASAARNPSLSQTDKGFQRTPKMCLGKWIFQIPRRSIAYAHQLTLWLLSPSFATNQLYKYRSLIPTFLRLYAENQIIAGHKLLFANEPVFSTELEVLCIQSFGNWKYGC